MLIGYHCLFRFLRATIKSRRIKGKENCKMFVKDSISGSKRRACWTCLKKTVSASVTLTFSPTLTWDDRYSFQGSENSERSQGGHITQIHKLSYISETGRVGNQTLTDIQHTGRSRHRVAVGFKGHTEVVHLNVLSAYLELLK